jgi:hypothetical protein
MTTLDLVQVEVVCIPKLEGPFFASIGVYV